MDTVARRCEATSTAEPERCNTTSNAQLDPEITGLLVVREDALGVILLFLAVDDLLAFSLTCRLFNRTRKSQGRQLRTSLAWTLGSPSLSSWCESVGCPSPYPHWAELKGRDGDNNERCNNNNKGIIVQVMGPVNTQGRQMVRLHSSLSCPEMQLCSPSVRVVALEPLPSERRAQGLRQAILVRAGNIRVLQPHEISRVKVLFIYFEPLVAPGQTRAVSGLAAQFVEMASQLNRGEAQLGKILCSKAALGVVGGDIRLADGSGLIPPRMFGVELLVEEKSSSTKNREATTIADDESPVLQVAGGRSFEILELLNEDYYGHPSSRETLLGQARIFHARVRWIPRLPPLSTYQEGMTRSFT